MFATPEQLHHFKFAERLFFDGTFFLVSNPIKQLFTINGFLKNEQNEIKLFPFCFVLMTRRQNADYCAVLAKIRQLVDSIEVGGPGWRVRYIVSDFECALFTSIRKTLPMVEHFGCAFHKASAVWLKVEYFKLVPDYQNDEEVRTTVQRLMCLCYLPADKIRGVFTFLKENAPKNNKLSSLIGYYERNWINGPLWKPENWTCFGKKVRTNNDTEGLHNKWNATAGRKMQFYAVANFLEELASTVKLEFCLFSYSNIKRYFRKSSQEKQMILDELTEMYKSGRFNSWEFLNQLVKKLKHIHPNIENSNCDPTDTFDYYDAYFADIKYNFLKIASAVCLIIS